MVLYTDMEAMNARATDVDLPMELVSVMEGDVFQVSLPARNRGYSETAVFLKISLGSESALRLLYFVFWEGEQCKMYFQRKKIHRFVRICTPLDYGKSSPTY